MKIILSLSQLKLHDACELSNRIDDFRAYHGYDPGGNTTFREWIACMPDVQDWIWACRCIGEPGRRIAVRVAVGAARRALPVFEAEYPNDNRPRQAVEVVEMWLKDPDSVVIEDVKAAADAAYVSWIACSVTASASWFEHSVTGHRAVKAAGAAYQTARVVYLDELTLASDSAVCAIAYASDAVVSAAEEHAAQKADFLAALEMEEKIIKTS